MRGERGGGVEGHQMRHIASKLASCGIRCVAKASYSSNNCVDGAQGEGGREEMGVEGHQMRHIARKVASGGIRCVANA